MGNSAVTLLQGEVNVVNVYIKSGIEGTMFRRKYKQAKLKRKQIWSTTIRKCTKFFCLYVKY